MNKNTPHHKASFLRAVTGAFVTSKLTPLIILFSLLLGTFAIFMTPSEEEPQIVVPMVDVMVAMPGASPKEIESRVVYPMEKLIWELPGVEYVYSTAMEGRAMTIVRFLVGEDTEKSIVKLYDKLYSHFDWIPPGCTKPILKPHSIDDVPIVSLTFWSDRYNAVEMRKMVARLDEEIRSIDGISSTFIKGGLRREVRVVLKPDALKALGLDAVDITEALGAQNSSSWISNITRDNRTFALKLNNFFKDIEEVKRAVIKTVKNTPVTLEMVADITDGPEEPESYVMIGAGKGHGVKKGVEALAPGIAKSAVTLAISKRKGRNATALANEVIAKTELMKGYLIPKDVNLVITRDYGETAKHKSDELLEHLLLATLSVAILMALLLGVRASLVVLVAIPVTLAFTLFIYYIYGYTLNRVTLFALIFCIGILVDDPIVGVENIVRHIRLPENRKRSFRDIIIDAVVEVGSPLVLATFTVIVAILPLAFVRGLMGPYMRPMPVGASVAMFLSMVISFLITPWTAYHVLGKNIEHKEEKEGGLDHIYRWAMEHLIKNALHRWLFLGFMGVIFLASCSLIYFKVVKVKMLPFDDKSEFQVIINMPEGTALEQTARVASELGQVLAKEDVITDYEMYVGTASPYNFNGLVRHYYMRSGPEVADIQVNLLPKGMRDEQSHPIAKRLRPALNIVAEKYGARIEVSEIPPGPPVLQTLVAEIYGPDYDKQVATARQVMDIFENTPGVVDVDWYMTDPQEELIISIDRDKAAASGVMPARAIEVIKTVVAGANVGLLHDQDYREDIKIRVRFPEKERSSIANLKDISIKSINGKLVNLSEIASYKKSTISRPIYHKNLKPVVYVTGDVSGDTESPVYAILDMNEKLEKMDSPSGEKLKIYYTEAPFSSNEWAMKWDGEWHVTYEVFRDMGAAFAVVIVLIFVLVVGWFRSYSVPLVILSPIPLSLIGIIPAHAMMDAFFTATSMIGFIAGAGIVVRNSIILADFVELRISEGMSIEEAVIDAGAVRFRPMLLTSSAVVVGSVVILFDPIFQGLAISLMAGEIAATIFSRMVVPVLYYLDHRIKAEGRLVL